MIDSQIFIGTLIIAITEVIKYYAPKVSGPVTIAVAGIIGGIVGLVDVNIGIANITIAQGILTGLSASGVVTVAKKVSATATYQR